MAHLYSHTHIPKSSGWSCPAAVGGTGGLPSSVISYSRTTFFFSFMILFLLLSIDTQWEGGWGGLGRMIRTGHVLHTSGCIVSAQLTVTATESIAERYKSGGSVVRWVQSSCLAGVQTIPAVAVQTSPKKSSWANCLAYACHLSVDWKSVIDRGRTIRGPHESKNRKKKKLSPQVAAVEFGWTHAKISVGTSLLLSKKTEESVTKKKRGGVVYGTTNCPGEMHLPNLHLRVSSFEFKRRFYSHFLKG
jgi:hypothetical protein